MVLCVFCQKGYEGVTYPSEVKLEHIACPLCSETKSEFVIAGRDMRHDLPGEFSIVKCHHCGLMRTNPRPTLESMDYYYPDDYTPYLTTANQSAPRTRNLFWKRVIRPIVRFMLETYSEKAPPLQPGRMLEVGCASGAFMYQMAKQGWVTEGIEPNPKAAQNARDLGYNVITGNLENAPDPEEPYDLVVGWMVIEHLHRPVEALRKLHQWAKPGSWLAISVPNIASVDFRLFKDNWYDLSLPLHTFHYTPQTVEKMLERGGWRLERVIHQRVLTTFIVSLGYMLQERRYNTRLTRALINYYRAPVYIRLLMSPLAHLLSFFGQTGRMTIWATRLDSPVDIVNTQT